MTKKELLYILTLILLLACCCNRPKTIALPDAQMAAIDSIRQAYNDPLQQRIALQKQMCNETDSICYYYAMTRYAYTFLQEPTQQDSLFILLGRARSYLRQFSEDPRALYALMDLYHHYNVVYSFYAHTDSSIHYAQEAYRLAERHGFAGKKLVKYALNLGDGYNFGSQYEKSFYWYHKALFISDSLELSEKEKLPVYNTFLRIHMNLRNYGRAEHYARLIGKQYTFLDFFDKYYYLNSTGMLYYYQQQYPQALRQYRKMEQMLLEHPDQFNIAEVNCCKINLADVYTELNRTDSARHYLNEALQCFTRELYPTYHFYGNLIQVRIALQEHRYKDAEHIALQLSNEEQIPPLFKLQWYDCLYELNKQQKRYEQALYYKTCYDQLNDSTLSHDVQLRTVEIQTRYRQDTLYLNETIQRKELQTQVAEQQLHLYFWVTICLALVLTGSLSYHHIRKRQQRKDENTRLKMASIRMESIRNRISPHFLMNALAHEIHTPQHNPKNIRNLAQLLRHNLTLVQEKFITLEEELKFIQLYVEIEKQNLLDDCFTFHVHTGYNVQPEKVILPSMMIQILVENAMKHGLRGREGFKFLGITITRKEASLQIEVTDNGGEFKRTGMDSSTGTGTGLRVITQTLQLLNQRNRKSIQFDIYNEKRVFPEGEYVCCTARIIIPDGYNFYKI